MGLGFGVVILLSTGLLIEPLFKRTPKKPARVWLPMAVQFAVHVRRTPPPGNSGIVG